MYVCLQIFQQGLSDSQKKGSYVQQIVLFFLEEAGLILFFCIYYTTSLPKFACITAVL